ncbi:hypothetical protein FA95DRAFT_1606271 [Auriscalpium vulgare]|uniref:Uncharacterized protein n=1 Tax=Auriscalpium vulgare TaxID=40419 RepID=A0ACB8RT36_9AGAM|nr:hypothetical protein FA95DRAFT_1606271 [Auriscalpium vulgare]
MSYVPALNEGVHPVTHVEVSIPTETETISRSAPWSNVSSRVADFTQQTGGSQTPDIQYLSLSHDFSSAPGTSTIADVLGTDTADLDAFVSPGGRGDRQRRGHNFKNTLLVSGAPTPEIPSDAPVHSLAPFETRIPSPAAIVEPTPTRLLQERVNQLKARVLALEEETWVMPEECKLLAEQERDLHERIADLRTFFRLNG